MKKQYQVNGMMCGHCAASVEKAIKAVNGVNDAKVSLEDKNVVVNFDEQQVNDTDIKKAVDAAGYELVL